MSSGTTGAEALDEGAAPADGDPAVPGAGETRGELGTSAAEASVGSGDASASPAEAVEELDRAFPARATSAQSNEIPSAAAGKRKEAEKSVREKAEGRPQGFILALCC